jgi:hypothetical protein
MCRAEDGVAKNILQSLAKSARRSGTAKVVTSETIRQRNEARAEARALAAATAAAVSSSAEAAAVEPEDEEPEVDLDPDRVVEALFNNGRPLTIRERAEKVGCWVVFFFFCCCCCFNSILISGSMECCSATMKFIGDFRFRFRF